MTFRNSLLHFTLTILSIISGSICSAADWPKWLGPNGNGSSPETGLLTNWDKTKPKILWKVPGGEGYSTVAVVGNRAYTLVQRGGKELVVCLDVKDGKQIWEQALAPEYKNNYGNGPRSTPTIEGDRVYATSVSGPIACINAKTGKIIWQHNLLKDFGVKNISWGLSASPFIYKNLVIALPGAEGASVVAYNKTSGELVWKQSSDKAAYSTPMVVKVGGQPQMVVFNAFGLTGYDPTKGEILWRMPWKTEYDCNICTPLAMGNHLFVTSGEKVGCALLELSASGKPSITWESKGKDSVMINFWANSVLHKGHLYGLAGEFSKRVDLRCVEAKTGKLKWENKGMGLGAVTLADGHLFITNKKSGDLILVEATPKGYQEKGRMPGLMGSKNRTSPTISNGKLYLRDLAHIYCLDISAK